MIIQIYKMEKKDLIPIPAQYLQLIQSRLGAYIGSSLGDELYHLDHVSGTFNILS